MGLTPEHDAFVLMAHYRSGTLNTVDGTWTYSLQSCLAQFHTAFPDVNISYDTFKSYKLRIVQRFEERNCICKRKSTGRPSVLTEDALRRIQEQLDINPSMSLRKIAAQTGMSFGSCRKALTTVHNFHPDEVSMVKKLKKPTVKKKIKVKTGTSTTQNGGEPYTIKEKGTTGEVEFEEIEIEPFQVSIEQINYDKTEKEETINYTTPNNEKQFKAEIDIEDTVMQMPLTNYNGKEEDAEETTANNVNELGNAKVVKHCTCRQCGKIFTCRSALNTHQRIHTGEQPYQCKHWFGEKAFTSSSHLVCHEQTHNGDQSYQCKFCEKRFATYDYLIVHERIHSGERP